jgi:hypothetical protein
MCRVCWRSARSAQCEARWSWLVNCSRAVMCWQRLQAASTSSVTCTFLAAVDGNADCRCRRRCAASSRRCERRFVTTACVTRSHCDLCLLPLKLMNGRRSASRMRFCCTLTIVMDGAVLQQAWFDCARYRALQICQCLQSLRLIRCRCVRLRDWRD